MRYQVWMFACARWLSSDIFGSVSCFFVEYYIYLYILLLCRLTVLLRISAGIMHVAPIMLINVLKNHEPPERVFVVHLLVVAAGCSPNVTNIMVSAPACQK